MTEAEADAEARRRNLELGRRPDGKGGHWHAVERDSGEWEIERIVEHRRWWQSLLAAVPW